MAISGQQVIAVGLQNESANSDSLYAAFNKTVDNFATLFACASPYNTFVGDAGITTNTNSNTNTITITNTGVLSLTAGDALFCKSNGLAAANSAYCVLVYNATTITTYFCNVNFNASCSETFSSNSYFGNINVPIHFVLTYDTDTNLLSYYINNICYLETS